MKTKIYCGIAVSLALALAAISQTASSPKHHVVFQLSEAEGAEWDTVISHVNNLQTAFAKDGGSQVEVVFFGDGIEMLRKTGAKYEDRLKKLADGGVTLAACQNAMRRRNLKSGDLFPFAKEVDSGVAELARKQEAGWAYLH
jgi:intracellular sulfur oxidation DsrE/DsrF family protein